MTQSKQPYEAPAVTTHGTVEELTQSTGRALATDNPYGVPFGTPVGTPGYFGSNY
jgi:hypothetical protein